MKGEYNEQDREAMLFCHRSRSKSRLQELFGYAKEAGYRKIGVANCLSMQKYADKLKLMLAENGFEVFAVNCKESGLDGCDISSEMKGPCCDPLSQAEYLNGCGTDFNINLGLCLGHGLLFQKYSKAPVTTLVVKDPATGHHSVDSLL